MKKAFTLVEIMVVVAIVLILILLATPNILRSRATATEATAVTNLKTLGNACQLYNMNRNEYPSSLDDLIPPQSNPPYIDSVLASGNKQGYDFIYARKGDGFGINANPTGIWLTLNARYFYLDQTGIIRWKRGGPAGAQDEILS